MRSIYTNEKVITLIQCTSHSMSEVEWIPLPPNPTLMMNRSTNNRPVHGGATVLYTRTCATQPDAPQHL